ncbi:GyrI-like domain-containing protein [Ornithobacterium rhinotracheale]|uniref:GyrI-like domain-containing protein n=1 Tax=Ornithobacterium rhinotracheale TaxID=28251 RepID=UPI001FF5C5DD|nr:GyrI-like domain-containing protein [Ornithobacterium rhinotracheale]MCK0205345.1 GyrI-like domain-containing protein [Ornithobacterium rhinotracheale]
MKKVIILLLVVMIGIVIFPVFLPKSTHEEAEYIYEANPKKVYDYFNNLKKMSQWFGWTGDDIETNAQFSTPAEGVGAYFKWSHENGEGGSVTITDAKENQFVGYNLSFGEEKGNTSEAIFQVLDDGKVKVIWTFDSAEVSYPFQVYAFFMRRSIKKNLQEGLEKLDELIKKEQAENGGYVQARAIREVREPAHKLFGVMQTTDANDESEYRTAVGEALGLVESYLIDENSVSPTQINGDVVYFLKRNASENNFVAGFFTEANVPQKEGMQYVEIPAYKCLTITVNNNTEDIKKAYQDLEKYAQEKGFYTLQSSWQIIREDQVQIYIPLGQ